MIKILNLSDFPSKINKQEIQDWIKKILDMWFSVRKKTFLKNIRENIQVFNKSMISWKNEIILFSSWWNTTITNLKNIEKKSDWAEKILIWYSDILHLFYYLSDFENIKKIYWITLRNLELIDNLNFSWRKKIWFNIIKKSLDKNIEKTKIIWWHPMIFLNMLYNQKKIYSDNFSLYLDFHWMDWKNVEYYLYTLNYLGFFEELCQIVFFTKEIMLNENKNIIFTYLEKIWKNYVVVDNLRVPLFEYFSVVENKVFYLLNTK